MSLCYGLQPAKFCYDQNNMRSHLIHCLERGRMELFPVRRERRENSVIFHSQSIKVYCVCRMPEVGKERMICCNFCKEWFHGDVCINVSQDAWKPHTRWLCDSCQ